MRRKLPGYFLLSFFSFCFFTVLFLAIAGVQASASQPLLQIKAHEDQQQPLPPTPTIYTFPPLKEQKTTDQQIPTPTVYQAQVQALPTITVTSTPVQKKTPETTPVPPTAIPTITDTPTPTATATPTQAPQPTSTDLDTLFNQYSATYHVSADELKKIAGCESGFNTNSDAGAYTGMFQFSANTWASVRGAMGIDPNPDLRKNAEEAIKTTAYMLSLGEENAWPNCH